MKKHRPLFIGILAVLTVSIFLFASCDGLNNPKEHNPDDTNSSGIISANQFPKPPAGTTYTGYIISWTDASGKQQTKTVPVPENITLEGGIKAGTTPTITPIVMPQETTPNVQTTLSANQFPQAPAGTTYTGYTISWTDASGKQQTKTVSIPVPESITLEGGIKASTTPTITPIVKPQETVPSAENTLSANQFPQASAGITYTGYTISWTDASGKQQTKTVPVPVPENITLEGGIKAGTSPAITPIVKPQETVPNVEAILSANQFPKPPAGTIYTGYTISWTDASGKQQTKTVPIPVPENITLEGGIKAGKTPAITPIVKPQETVPIDPNPPTPQPAGNWEEAINKGVTALEKHKWDDALVHFKNAYAWEKNNTTKAYYALVKLASISIKPETVNFMKNRMGFETYPGTLDALVNLEWFKEYDVTYTRGRFSTYYDDFQEDVNGGYIRANGYIINAGEEQEGQTVIDLDRCHEHNTIAGLYSQRTDQLIQPEWVYAGSRTLYDHIEATPKQDRESQYYAAWQWQEGKRFVVEEVSETGSFMVGSRHIPAEMIPSGTKRYSAGENHGWVDKYYEYERGEVLPQVKATEWGKDMYPIFYIPAYLVEHSKDKNVDALVDELYNILFGAEYTEAKSVLNSLDSTPVTVDKRLLELTGLSQYLGEDSTVEVQKEQLLGVIGGFTLAKGAFEFIQSYSFNTDLSILKFDWKNVEFDKGLAQNINGYDQNLDPFNNGFLKGRRRQKLQDSKQSFIEGADVLIKLYDSLTNHPDMPAKAKEEVKALAFVKAVVTELRDAIKEGRKADLLIGEDNMLKESFTAFELDMGKIFTYEYFKLSNAFEMNGTKPKVFPAADGKPAYLQMRYKTFIDDFMKVTEKWSERDHDNNVIQVHEDDISEAWDGKIWLDGPLGEKIKKFYE